jgi:ectoine hydroxylase-related dioxygenase (phytanoyl-CoA dioxygenase family)
VSELNLSAFDLDAIIEEIDARGYCVVPHVLTPAEADAARATLIDLVESEVPDPADRPRLQRVWRIAVKHRRFLELMAHPLLVAVWQRYLGADMVCSSWTGITLHPGQDQFTWHIDYPYWSMTPPYPVLNLAAQSVWLLDDFTEENGGTGVIPASHRLQHPPDFRTDEWPPGAEVITGTRGSVVLANGAWHHCSRPNTTDQPRSALLGMYVRSFCMTQEDMRSQLAEIADPSPLQTQLLCGNQHVPALKADY